MANAGSFRKGEKRPNQGKRGPDKANLALKEMILGALSAQPGGGVEYLKRQAVECPGPFLSLLGKVLPTTLVGDKDSPIKLEVIERIIVDPKP